MLATCVGEEGAYKYRGQIYLAGSASAEFFADIALCPMEMIKVKVSERSTTRRTIETRGSVSAVRAIVAIRYPTHVWHLQCDRYRSFLFGSMVGVVLNPIKPTWSDGRITLSVLISAFLRSGGWFNRRKKASMSEQMYVTRRYGSHLRRSHRALLILPYPSCAVIFPPCDRSLAPRVLIALHAPSSVVLLAFCDPQVQTSIPGTFPTNFGEAFSNMQTNAATTKFPFGSLVPLWSRQIPYTMAKFYFFEKVTVTFFDNVTVTLSRWWR